MLTELNRFVSGCCENSAVEVVCVVVLNAAQLSEVCS